MPGKTNFHFCIKANVKMHLLAYLLLEGWLKLIIDSSRSVEHYSLSYSNFDEMAQTYCASRSPGWVFAIRRNCANAPTCNDMCAAAENSILETISYERESVSCYDAFHIHKNHPLLKANPGSDQPDSGKVNIGSYGYGSGGCTWTANHCGPNYCCCKAYN
ncbi:uncharacterized protein LOC132728582 [Ruditapes philippinarum]|uniref:uncharacterized protein LOC132728582 n=1 Tax=Ruditapes philippinarum TaxID=129788 RepID=UPI00295BF66E|nr:uncharacterized protein LOC132728582 [Ruditapes philippinarum]